MIFLLHVLQYPDFLLDEAASLADDVQRSVEETGNGNGSERGSVREDPVRAMSEEEEELNERV